MNAQVMIDTLQDSIDRVTEFIDNNDMGGYVLRFPSGICFARGENNSGVIGALKFTSLVAALVHASGMRDGIGAKPEPVSTWWAACDEIAGLRNSLEKVKAMMSEAS